MKRFPLLALVIPIALAFNVQPASIQKTVTPGSQIVETVKIENTDANKTHTYVLSATGSISPYVWFEDKDLTIPNKTYRTVKVLFLIPSNINANNLTGYITVQEDTGSSKSIYVSFNINPWVYSTEQWFEIPCILHIDTRVFNVTFTEDKSGVKIDGTVLYRDQEKVFNDVKIKVVDINREANKVYLKIETKYQNPNIWAEKIETKKEEKVSGENIEVYPDVIEKRLQQGIKSSSVIVWLYNGLDKKIRILRAEATGDIFEFEDGSKEPISEIQIGSKEVEPGDEAPIVIKLRSVRLEPGSYSVLIRIYYKIGEEIKKETVVLNVRIFKGKVSVPGEVTINIPDQVTYNQEFQVVVNNVDSSYNIEVTGIPSGCLSGSLSFQDNKAIWKGKVTCQYPSVGIMVDVKKDGKVVKSSYKTVMVNIPQAAKKNIRIVIEPSNPKPGDIVNIRVEDVQGNEIPNAEIYVNGEPMSSFIAEPKKTYTIRATCPNCRETTRTVRIPGKRFKVEMEPPSPKIGDTVCLTVKDADTNEEATGYQLKVNGKVISGNCFNITREGTYRVEVTHEEYETWTKTLNLIIPLEVTVHSPSTLNVKETIYLTANKDVIWRVLYKDPETNQTIVVYRSPEPEKVLLYTPDKPGEYMVEAGNKRYTFYVKAVSPGIGGILSYLNYILLFVLACIIGFGIYKKFAKKTYRYSVPSQGISVSLPTFRRIERPSVAGVELSKEEAEQLKAVHGEQKEQK